MPTKSKEQINYRQLQAELTAVLADLESDQLDIDASIAKYQRGMEIVTLLQGYLKTAQNKVSKVTASSLNIPAA